MPGNWWDNDSVVSGVPTAAQGGPVYGPAPTPDKPPVGYQMSPGGLSPIPGGPADPTAKPRDPPAGYRPSGDGGLAPIPGGPADPNSKPHDPPAGYRWAATGGLEIIPGGPADPKNQQDQGKPTESQSKAAAFLTRALGANSSYSNVEGIGPRGIIGQTIAENYPNLANTFSSSDRQVSDQAQHEFIASVLRMDSGAAIPPEELVTNQRIYFPQPGDSEDVLKQKQLARQRAIEGLKIEAGPLAQQGLDAFARVQGQAAGDAGGPHPASVDREIGAMGAAALPDAPPGGGGGGGVPPIAPDTWTAQKAAQFWGQDVYDRAGHPLPQSGGEAYDRKGNYLGLFGNVTEDDAASPLPTSLIAQGKSIIADSESGASPNPQSRQIIEDTRKLRDAEGDQSGIRGVSTLLTNGITGGLYDEAAGVGNGIAAFATGRDPVQAYYNGRNAQRSAVDDARAAHPTIGGAAEFLGGIAGAGINAAADAAVPTIAEIAKAGATYGGVSGYGEGNGFEDSVTRAAIGAGAGAATGAGAGKLGELIAAKRAAQAAAGLTPSQEVAAAAARQGVDVLPADVGGPATRMASAVTAKSLGGPIMAKAAENSIGTAAAARDRVAAEIGNFTDATGAGQAAQSGARDFIRSSEQRGGELFDSVSVPAEKEASTANTTAALTEIVKGMKSNPELSKLWTGNPRLKATLDALTPTDTRAAGQQQLTAASDRLQAAEEALKSARATADNNLHFERGQARDAVQQAHSAYDDLIANGQKQMMEAQDRLDALRDQVPSVQGIKARNEAKAQLDQATQRFAALRSRDPEHPEVGPALRSIQDAEAGHNNLRFSEPSSDAVTQAQTAVQAAKADQDAAFVAARQPPQGGKVSWEDMKRLRSTVGQIVGQPSLTSDGATNAAMRKVYGALTADMQQTAAATGPRALTEFQRANQYWRGRQDRIDNVLSNVLGSDQQKSGEAAFQQINRWAQSQGGDYDRLARTVRSLPKDEAATVRSTIVSRLGDAKPGRITTGGTEFSPAEFSTQWNKLSDRAKSVLFPDAEHRNALNDLATVMAGMKRSGEFANTSNTGLVVNGGAVAAGALSHPLATAVAVVSQLGAGKLLSSPGFARWLARMPTEAAPSAIRLHVTRLGALASREVAIGSDIRGLQEQLRMAFGQSPAPRIAASQQNEDVRREEPRR